MNPFTAAVAVAPFDDALRLVWADEHVDAGDPRAEAIQLEAALPGLEPDRQAHARARLASLVAQHGADWAGPLGRFIDVKKSTFRLGFLETAVLSWNLPQPALRKLAGDDAWRTVRRVFFQGVALELDAGKRRTPEAVTQLEVLRKMPWLTGVGGLLPSIFLALGDFIEQLDTLHLRLPAPPSAKLVARLEKLRALKRLGLQENRWAPAQQLAPMWRPFSPPGLELLSLETHGAAMGWARLGLELPVPRLAARSPEMGHAWFITRQTKTGLQLDFWLPDAGYLAESGIRVLESLPTRDLVSVLVWVPGALHDDHQRRVRQALARFSKAETAVLPGALRFHPVFD